MVSSTGLAGFLGALLCARGVVAGPVAAVALRSPPPLPAAAAVVVKERQWLEERSDSIQFGNYSLSQTLTNDVLFNM